MRISYREIGKWMVVLLLVFCEKALGSHVVHKKLQESDSNVTIAVTSPALKAVYHFRPPLNWINGTYLHLFSLLTFSYISFTDLRFLLSVLVWYSSLIYVKAPIFCFLSPSKFCWEW